MSNKPLGEACEKSEHDLFLVTMSDLLRRLSALRAKKTAVIPWSSPVPAFGDLQLARVATLGLNPSNREFVDEVGRELNGAKQRLPTLRSLGLKSWDGAKRAQIDAVISAGRNYFKVNPYDGWFRTLDRVISGTGASYYCSDVHACHLDLIPYATHQKWTELRSSERSNLMDVIRDALGLTLRASSIHTLILNGSSVAHHLERLANTRFQRIEMRDWCLPRRSGRNVCGYAIQGFIDRCGGVDLGRRVAVIGFNHNLQSSFGVTKHVKEAIRAWIESVSKRVDACNLEKKVLPRPSRVLSSVTA